MSFSQSVLWWDEWQLRFLVLGSLFFQYFLFAAALLRKRRIPHWFRSLIWLAYQAGDVVAIYALATLFNRHRKDEMGMVGSDSAHLDTLWAPILLLHLGGQDGITAYSIEDNENWRRHFLVAASQITVAVYVFRKTWWLQNGRLLLRTAILLFVPGVLKCLEKPWALKNATATSIMNSSDSRQESTLDLDDEVSKKKIVSLDDYVKQARDHFVNRPLELFEDDLADEPYHLFVDLGHPYAIRLKNLQLVAPPRPATAGGEREEELSFYREVHDLLRSSLSRAFDRLYTKNLASFGGLLRAAVVLAALIDIAVLQKRHLREYDRADIVVTYVLLACTAALELVSACVVLGSGLPWPDDRVSQYNLIGYLARNKKHRRKRRLALMVGYKDHLDTIWCTAPPEPSLRVTKLVHDHITGGWKDCINSVESYRRFNDGRGQWTLKREGCGGPAMAESMCMPFDESVLVWHLATEFCYFDHVDADVDATRHGRVVSNYMAYLLAVKPEMLVPGARPGLFRSAYEKLKKIIDEKKSAEDDLVLLEKTEPMSSPPKAKDEMARKIIQKVKSAIGSWKVLKNMTSTTVIDLDELINKAWEVACELMEFAKVQEVNENRRLIEEENRKVEKEKLTEAGTKKVEEEEKKRKAAEVAKAKLTEAEEKKLKEEDKRRLVEEERKKKERMNRAKKYGDERMWAVIQGVWVEMLCFSAGRCRGYLHARSLAKGGEYLSHVWLLLSYMGMETMPERMQRPEILVGGDTGALVKDPTEEDEMGDEKPRAQALVAQRTAAMSAVAPITGEHNV